MPDLQGLAPIGGQIIGSLVGGPAGGSIGGVIGSLIGGFGGGGGTTGGPEAALNQIYGTAFTTNIRNCIGQVGVPNAPAYQAGQLNLLPPSAVAGTPAEGIPGFAQLQPWVPQIRACLGTGPPVGAPGGFIPAAVGGFPPSLEQPLQVLERMIPGMNVLGPMIRAASGGPGLRGTSRPVFGDQGQVVGQVWAPVTYHRRVVGTRGNVQQILFPGWNNGKDGLYCAHRTGDFAASDEIACMSLAQARRLARQAWGRELAPRPPTLRVRLSGLCRRRRRCCG